MKLKKYQRIFAPLLYPASLVYGIIVSVRNKLFDWHILKSEEFDLPVISVGNITVGGTGKTPHVEYLLKLLSSKLKLGFLSRGYKRKTTGYIEANEKTNSHLIGDEPYQVFRTFGQDVLVAVDENRVHGIKELFKKNLQAIVLDDAYQHRYVKPGVSILLMDYNRPVFSDHLLPFGELREGTGGIKRANIVIVTKVPKSIKPIEKRLLINELNLFPYQFLFFTRIEYGELTSVFNEEGKGISLLELKKKKPAVLLVSGIANPSPLIEAVNKYTSELSTLIYSDHQEYGPKQLKEITSKFESLAGKEKIVVTTEKDAVKIREVGDETKLPLHFYYLPIKVRFLDNGEEEFNKIIREFAEKNKPINRLHK